MNDKTRIDQFKQMAEADPENELGHFSLGKAYHEAARYEDAIPALLRALELNPRMSKAFQILGESYEMAGRKDEAVDVLTRGVQAADALGDRMPRDAMAAALHRLGADVPDFKNDTVTKTATVRQATEASPGFACTRCGRPDGQLPKPPIKGKLGALLHAHTCASCWREWIAMGTKVINELGIALSTGAGQEAYDQYMVEFLQLDTDTSLDPTMQPAERTTEE